MASGSLSANALIVGGRAGHSRFYDHFGTEPDTVVVLDGAIGQYPSGTTVHVVLASLVDRISALEGATHRSATFSIGAWIGGTSINAVITKHGITFTKHLDAEIRRGLSTSFAANSVLVRHPTGSFSADAYFIDLVC